MRQLAAVAQRAQLAIDLQHLAARLGDLFQLLVTVLAGQHLLKLLLQGRGPLDPLLDLACGVAADLVLARHGPQDHVGNRQVRHATPLHRQADAAFIILDFRAHLCFHTPDVGGHAEAGGQRQGQHAKQQHPDFLGHRPVLELHTPPSLCALLLLRQGAAQTVAGAMRPTPADAVSGRSPFADPGFPTAIAPKQTALKTQLLFVCVFTQAVCTHLHNP